MNKKALVISIVAVVSSFIGGFILANALNRKEITNLQAEAGRLRNSSPNSAETVEETALTDEEIRGKIAEADANPANVEFQKNLAIALYRYASMKQQSKWLPDVARLLTRSFEKNPKDFNAAVSLGNIYFDIAHDEQNKESYKKSREFYHKALDIKPNDIETQTDLGLTYLMSSPPEIDKAVTEFQKSLKIDAKHEKTLQNMIQAQIGLGNLPSAEQYLSLLKETNPNNEAIAELSSRLLQEKNNLQK